MIRRSFLKHLAVLPLAAAAVPSTAGAAEGKLKIMIKNAWDRTTRPKPHFHFCAATPFLRPATKSKSFFSAKRYLSFENQ